MSVSDLSPDRSVAATDEEDLSAADLADLLTVAPTDTDVFQATNSRYSPGAGIYGGQVAAQALVAGGATVDQSRRPHSLHCYFLSSGKAELPVSFHVAHVRDGRSFSVRQVVGRQGDLSIFTATMSFHIEEPGLEYQRSELPEDSAAPETLLTGPRKGHNTMFEIREPDRTAGREEVTAARLWGRTRGPLGDDPLLHAAAITYLSDMAWAFGQLGSSGGPSLDHAIWFHRANRADEWLLLEHVPTAAAGGTGVFHGTVHRRDGILVATISQETLLEPRGRKRV